MNLLVLLGLLIAQALPATFNTVRDVPLPGRTSLVFTASSPCRSSAASTRRPLAATRSR
jgi:hypothetical protein